MQILTAYHTDIGISKQTNQDSLGIQIAETSLGTVVMAMVCDGMGGLAKGELASASVIRAFQQWFTHQLPNQLSDSPEQTIRAQWDSLIQQQNDRIGSYGTRHRIKLGTTLTALLLVDTKFLLIAHVGDSRAYRVTHTLDLLTEDQTVVHREIAKGNLTPEQAHTDPYRHVLLQCIGASRTVIPEFVVGQPHPQDVYLLCTDGFRHAITDQEMFCAFRPEELTNEQVIEYRVKQLTDLNKQRYERDNITAIVIKL